MNKYFESLLVTVKREKLMSISNVIVMALTFLVLGFFLILMVLSQSAVNILEQQAQVTIFFKDDFTEAKILEIRTSLETDERVTEVAYISKEKAFELFMEYNKDEPLLLESIPANILPASLDVKTKKLVDLSVLAEEFGQLDGVESVKYFRDVIERFRFWSNVVFVVGLSLVVAFFVLSYAVVIATVRMTISSKGAELEILKLVGASDSYVRSPLVFQSVFFGTVSSVFASVVLLILLKAVSSVSFFGGRPLISFYVLSFKVETALFAVFLVMLLLASGVFLGYLGSWTAVKKYLKY